MYSLRIYCICVLKTYLTPSYPKEIIMLIISMMPPNIKISCGYDCTAFIINGDIYVCDQNNLVPKKQIFNKGKIDSIYYGMNHTIFINKSKKVMYSWGNNDYGQLGLGNFVDENTPHQILIYFKSKNKSVACGKNHTFVVTESDVIYGWGCNENGELGLGDYINRDMPHKLPIENVKSVNCGKSYTMILTKQGELFSCGHNYWGLE